MQSLPPTLDRARALTGRSAQHLVLLGFQTGPGKPIFGSALSTYHEMFDPQSSDERRLGACRRYLEPVKRHADLEELQSELHRLPGRLDPYGRELSTTLRSALLRVVLADLADAVHCFEAAGVKDGHSRV